MPAKNATPSNPIVSFLSRQYHRALGALNNYYSPILDVSRWQWPINWKTMWDRGVRLVILRLSVGNYYMDPQFNEYYAGAKNQGFLVGAYHVTRPVNSVASQWAKILSSLAGRPLDIPLVLDNELDDNLSPAQISGMIEGLTFNALNHFGKYPIQYLSPYWWNAHTIPKPVFGKCPLFIARYSNLSHPWNDNPASLRPRDWQDWALWQYSADGNGLGSYFGVGSHSVDIDRSRYPTLEETIYQLNGAVEPPPDPDPEPEPEPGDDFMVKFKVLVPTLNVRDLPSITGKDIGDVHGGDIVTALDVVPATASSVWVKIGDGQWVALVHAGTVYLERVDAA